MAVVASTLAGVLVTSSLAAPPAAHAGTRLPDGLLTVSPEATALVAGAQPATSELPATVSLGADGDVAFIGGPVATNRAPRVVLDAGNDHQFAAGTYVNHTGSDSLAVFNDGTTSNCGIAESTLLITSALYSGPTLTQLTGSYSVRCNSTRKAVGTFAYPANGPQAYLQADDTDIDLTRTPFQHGKTFTVTLHNPSPAPLDVTSAGLAGGQGLSIVADGCSATTVPAAGTCSLGVRYQPVTGSPQVSQLRITTPSYPTAFPFFIRAVSDKNAFGEVFPLAPTRVFDSSTGQGRPGSVTGPFAASVAETVQVGGLAGVPNTGVAGVMLDVTVSGAALDGQLVGVKGDAAFPGAARSMAYEAGRTTTRLVVAGVAADGTVDVMTSSDAQVAIDVVAWIADDTWTDTTGFLLNFSGLQQGRGSGTLSTTAAMVSVAYSGNATPNVEPQLNTFTVRNPTADADVKIWPDGQSEPALALMHVTAGVTESSLVLVRPGPSGKVNVRLTAGQATLVSSSGVVLQAANPPGSSSAPGWSGRILVPDAPLRSADSHNGNGTPLAGNGGTAAYTFDTLSQTFGIPIGGTLGVLTTVESGAAGTATEWSGNFNPTANDAGVLVTRVGHQVSDLVANSTAGVLVRNFSAASTHLTIDTQAVVTGVQPGNVPVNVVAAAAEVDGAGAPPMADAVAPPAPPSPAIAAADVVTTLGDASWSDTVDVTLASGSWDADADATTLEAGSLAVMSDGTVRFANADATRSISFNTGTDGLVAVGTYVTPPNGVDDDGIVAIAIGDHCPFGVSDAVTEIDQVEYSGPTLTKLVGRFSAICGTGGGGSAHQDTVTHGTFSFPAGEAQPILQIDQRRADLTNTSIHTGLDRTVVVSNAGTATLSLGPLALVLMSKSAGVPDDAVKVTSDGCSSATLAPAATCSVTLHHEVDTSDPLSSHYRLEIPSNATSSLRPYWLDVEASTSWNGLGDYYPVAAQAYFDTRTGLGRTGALTTPLVANVAEQFVAANRAGVPVADDALSAVVRLTVTSGKLAGTVTLFDADVGLANGISMAFPKSQVLTQQVVVPISASGMAAIRATQSVHVHMDVIGFIGSELSDRGEHVGLRFSPGDPTRVVDSKKGLRTKKAALKAKELRHVSVGASGNGVVALVVTVTAPSKNTDLYIWPEGLPQPTAGAVTFPKGVARSVTMFVDITASGSLTVLSTAASISITIDVTGGFNPVAGDKYLGRMLPYSAPIRLLDTRLPNGKGPKIKAKKLNGWDITNFESAAGVIGASGLIGTLITTASSGTPVLKLFAYQFNGPIPTGQTITAKSGQDVSTMAVISTTAHQFLVYNTTGSTHYVFDLSVLVLYAA